MSKLHLWKEEPVVSEGHVKTQVVIERDEGPKSMLWYSVPEKFVDRLTDSCDPFVVGTIFTAMRESGNLVVHGNVSKTLLANIEEFNAIWASWRPQLYSRIDIIADKELEDADCARPHDAIAAVSGGVDASFTVYRHKKGLAGRAGLDLKAGVFIHGLDISLDRGDIFSAAAEKK